VLLLHLITISDTPLSVELLWKGDQPDAQTPTWQHTTLITDNHPCSGGIRIQNPSSERLQTQALDRAATRFGMSI